MANFGILHWIVALTTAILSLGTFVIAAHLVKNRG